MPEGWHEVSNSGPGKWWKSHTLGRAHPVKMSGGYVTLTAKLRPDGAGWRWNVWFKDGPLTGMGRHVATGWCSYRPEAAEEADKALAQLSAQYHMGVL